MTWCIWGTMVFAVGWIVVGLPIIALGDRVSRIPYMIVALVGGLGGAFAIDLPGLLFWLFANEPVQPGQTNTGLLAGIISGAALGWDGIAFAIAAPASVLYRMFLGRATSKSPPR